MKIFVTGASGFIGEEVALGLRRAGHEVWGLVRDPKKAANLAQNEIHVVIGDLSDRNSYRQWCEHCNVIIHCAADWNNYQIDNIALETVFESASNGVEKKLFVYTSGVLVLPHSEKIQDEDSPTDKVSDGFFATRIGNEQRVLKSTVVNGVVVRPAFVFGKKSKHFVNFFADALSGKIVLTNGGDIKWSEVHIDDLVDGYKRIVEAPPSVVSGQIFHFADDSRYSLLQIAETFGRVAGYKGDIVIAPTTNRMLRREKSVLVDYRKAQRILGWTPRHRPMLDEAELYFSHWKALHNVTISK